MPSSEWTHLFPNSKWSPLYRSFTTFRAAFRCIINGFFTCLASRPMKELYPDTCALEWSEDYQSASYKEEKHHNALSSRTKIHSWYMVLRSPSIHYIPYWTRVHILTFFRHIHVNWNVCTAFTTKHCVPSLKAFLGSFEASFDFNQLCCSSFSTLREDSQYNKGPIYLLLSKPRPMSALIQVLRVFCIVIYSIPMRTL